MRPRQSIPALPIVLTALVVIFAAVLRLDGLTGRFGLVSQPAWLQVLQGGSQTLVGILHPPVAGWQPEPEYPTRMAHPPAI